MEVRFSSIHILCPDTNQQQTAPPTQKERGIRVVAHNILHSCPYPNLYYQSKDIPIGALSSSLSPCSSFIVLKPHLLCFPSLDFVVGLWVITINMPQVSFIHLRNRKEYIHRPNCDPKPALLLAWQSLIESFISLQGHCS